ncbi:ParA family protein [Brachybacterium phenoliresistens]|uniref:Chromosome partitioning protein n=1 Tax=Brachybacterium phenoliresistens TaxID=396014 RepID=Z9JYB9_9MICO|nr:AAA family ATPase [Brachybacterium phenoliresistens]EWS82792.1 chromosome partitioning protein [Brachybacterium phenoliresistens]
MSDTAAQTLELGLGPTGRPLPEFPEPPALDGHGPARVISMVNQKGGVGKTTSVISLGAALAEIGRRVLLVDLDPQGALSAGTGINPYDLDVTVYNLLMERDHDVREVIQETRTENLDVLPANIDLSAAEVTLVNEVAREMALARVLRPVMDDYDVIIIDCQPSLGLLTINALAASHGVIIPLEAEYFALRGVALLVETIEKVQDRINPALEIDGILITMFDQRTLHAREVCARVVEAFPDVVFHTTINRTVKFPDASVAAEPITSFASNTKGADAYRQLARELIARGGAA